LKLVWHVLLSLPVAHVPLLHKTIAAQPDGGFHYGRSSKRDSLRFTNDAVAGPRTTLINGHSAPMIFRSPSPVCRQHDKTKPAYGKLLPDAGPTPTGWDANNFVG